MSIGIRCTAATLLSAMLIASAPSLAADPVVLLNAESWGGSKTATWEGVLDMTGAGPASMTLETPTWKTYFDFDGDAFSVLFTHQRKFHPFSYKFTGNLSDATYHLLDDGTAELALHLRSANYGSSSYKVSLDYVAETYDQFGSAVLSGNNGLMHLVATVPEPSEYAMLISGLGVIAAAKRRKRKEV